MSACRSCGATDRRCVAFVATAQPAGTLSEWWSVQLLVGPNTPPEVGDAIAVAWESPDDFAAGADPRIWICLDCLSERAT